ncbi:MULTISPECIES: hypothetical protein [Kitasatospora]|uniref:Uncharacterized protein n=1 Tax=Kitasatospora cystarginea TaxID=58350 RepID=A0ABN3EUU0_9ACTN
MANLVYKKLLTTGQGSVPGRLVAGDHRRVGIGSAIVESGEAQVGDGTETVPCPGGARRMRPPRREWRDVK